MIKIAAGALLAIAVVAAVIKGFFKFLDKVDSEFDLN